MAESEGLVRYRLEAREQIRPLTATEALEERVAQAREQVKTWPEWVLTRSGFDRVLRGERVEVPGERVERSRRA